jgi:hypothetical protein
VSILNRAPAPAVRLAPDVLAELDGIISKCLEMNCTLRLPNRAPQQHRGASLAIPPILEAAIGLYKTLRTPHPFFMCSAICCLQWCMEEAGNRLHSDRGQPHFPGFARNLSSIWPNRYTSTRYMGPATSSSREVFVFRG